MKGIENEDDSEEDDDDEDDNTKERSVQELSTLRYYLVNDRRENYLNQSSDMIAYIARWAMGGNRAGSRVIAQIPVEVRKAIRRKTLPEKFDHLFGLTMSLVDDSSWIDFSKESRENGSLDSSVETFLDAWRALYLRSDAELGIDSEFTRPAVQFTLQQFVEMVEENVELDLNSFEVMIRCDVRYLGDSFK